MWGKGNLTRMPAQGKPKSRAPSDRIASMNALPLILDTDIGDDIDDALALAVILNSPELDLRGVTTVFRNAPRRVVLTRELLKTYQREEVPVFAGCSKPLLQNFEARLGSQFEILKETALETPTPHAIDFLISESGADKDEAPETPLTIGPIGPLTNVALALAREPQMVSSSRLVLMGGMWNCDSPDYKAEWNIACDPEAAAMVFNSGIEISMIGLDVTSRCRLETKHLEKIKAHDSAQAGVLSRLIELWMRESKHAPILHDPLAVLTLLDDCVQFEEKKIEVALCGKERGQTQVVPGTANACVAVNVDAPRAIELFMERILAL